VRAKPLERRDGKQQNKGTKVKIVITKVPQDSKIKAGAALDLSGSELDVLAEAGHEYITASEHAANERVRSQAKGLVISAVNRAVEREAIVPKGDGENTVEKVTATAVKQLEQGADPEFVLAFIDGLPGKAAVQASNRTTRFQQDMNGGIPFTTLEVTGVDIKDATNGYIKAMEHQNELCRSNQWAEATKQSKEASVILQKHHLKASDLLMTDAVKGATRFDPNTIRAATFSDPNAQVGALAGDLILMRNLGFLKYKLPWLGKLTTDFSGEPAKFGQAILTRYITPPDVLTWVPGVGFTSQANQISDSGTGTTQSGGLPLSTEGAGAQALDATNIFGIPKKSVPSTTDKSVTMNMFKATEVEFPVSLLGGTIRNLFAEQYGAQTYSLAQEINTSVLAGIYAATWNGIKTEYVKSLANWNLTGMIGVKNAMTISKIPDVGRFVLLHSFYHDKLLEDSNLLSAKAILALINKDVSSFESGEVPSLFGVKPLESQLSSATSAGALTTWTDDATLGTTAKVGFAGNMSSYLFVSRPPQDWTTTLTQLGIPSTASVRLVTEPDSGLTVMVFSYADNGKMSISQRVCVMWGHAQGDPRVGIVIKPA
jgi:hypothetical protein